MDQDAIWYRGRPRPRPVSSYDTRACFSDVLNRLLQRCVCHGSQVCHKLQQVLNVAAPIVNGTKKSDRGLTQLLHANLHWFDVPECIKCKLCMTMHQCQIGTAAVCDSTMSTSLGETVMYRKRRTPSKYGGRAFAVASHWRKTHCPNDQILM